MMNKMSNEVGLNRDYLMVEMVKVTLDEAA